MNAVVEKDAVEVAMVVRGRVIRRTEDENAAPLITMLFIDNGGRCRIDDAPCSCDKIQFRDAANGFNVGDEFDVTFIPRAKEPAPY